MSIPATPIADLTEKLFDRMHMLRKFTGDGTFAVAKRQQLQAEIDLIKQELEHQMREEYQQIVADAFKK